MIAMLLKNLAHNFFEINGCVAICGVYGSTVCLIVGPAAFEQAPLWIQYGPPIIMMVAWLHSCSGWPWAPRPRLWWRG